MITILKRIKSKTGRIYHAFFNALKNNESLNPPPVQEASVGFHSDIFGHKMYSNVTDIAIHIGSLQGVPITHYPYGEIGFIQNTIKAGQTVVDIGANIGYFTLMLARQVGPAGKVFSFEPGPISFALLTANVWINGYQNVVLENKAVSSKTEKQTLYLCPTGESDNRVYSDNKITFRDEKRISQPIEAVSLDDYFSHFQGQIHFLKMDTQGGEYLVIKGMEKVIKRNPGMKMVMEFSPGGLGYQGIGSKEFVDLLFDMGFSVYDLLETEPMIKVDRDYLIKNYVDCGKMTNLVLVRED